MVFATERFEILGSHLEQSASERLILCAVAALKTCIRRKGGRGAVTSIVFFAIDLIPLGDTPYNSLYREAPLERGTFFRPQVYKSVGPFTS